MAAGIALRNFLFLGFPFFMMGMLIHEREDRITKAFQDHVLVLLFLVGEAEAIVSRGLLGKNELYLGSIVAAFSVFVFALKRKDVKYGKFTEKLSMCSTYIYIFHMLLGGVTWYILRNMGVNLNSAVLQWTRPIIVCAMSLCFSLLIVMIKTAKKKES